MSEYVAKSEEYRGYTVKIINDWDAESPRTAYDNGTYMVMAHNRYDMPNEVDLNFDNFDGWSEIAAYLQENYDIVGIRPVYMIDHGNVAYSVGDFADEWDSGQVGFIFMDHAGQEEMGTPDDLVDELLAGDVETFSSWASGDTWGYVAENPEGKTVDSCWGYIGDEEWDYMLEEAKGAVDWDIEENNWRALATISESLMA